MYCLDNITDTGNSTTRMCNLVVVVVVVANPRVLGKKHETGLDNPRKVSRQESRVVKINILPRPEIWRGSPAVDMRHYYNIIIQSND